VELGLPPEEFIASSKHMGVPSPCPRARPDPSPLHNKPSPDRTLPDSINELTWNNLVHTKSTFLVLRDENAIEDVGWAHALSDFTGARELQRKGAAMEDETELELPPPAVELGLPPEEFIASSKHMGVPSPCPRARPDPSPLHNKPLPDLPDSMNKLRWNNILRTKSTFLVLRDDTPKEDGGRARALSDFTGACELQWKGAVVEDATELVLPPAAVESRALPEEFIASNLTDSPQEPVLAGWYEPMWCSVQRTNMGDAVILPCPMRSGATPEEEAAGTLVELWCWLQPTTTVTQVFPCTVHETECDLTSSAELACAPASPPAGSFVPPWDPGPYLGSFMPTTLTLAKLPLELTQEALLEILDREELSGFYDFLFLVADDSCTTAKHSEAIINFTRHKYALAAAARFHGRRAWGTCSENDPCEIRWSFPVQGLTDNVEHYRNHPVNSYAAPRERRPAIFKNGWPEAFPPAT